MSDSNASGPAGSSLIRLNEADNVAVVTAAVQAGRSLEFDGRTICFSDPVAMGHKVAVVPITAGEKVLKYGAPIGSATRNIRPGQHVHTHNVTSDYLPTHTPEDPPPG